MASMLAASEVAAITIAALSVLQRIQEFLKQPRRNVSAACLLAQRISALEQPLRCLQDVCAARGDSQVVQSVATACLRVHSAVCDAENVIQDILVRQDGGRVKEKVQLLLGAARRREALEECHAELSEAQELLHAAMSMGIFYNTVLQQVRTAHACPGRSQHGRCMGRCCAEMVGVLQQCTALTPIVTGSSRVHLLLKPAYMRPVYQQSWGSSRRPCGHAWSAR